MLCDAHFHPSDLLEKDPAAEEQRRALGIAAAASAWRREEFAAARELALAAAKDGAAPIKLCFAVHPQVPKEVVSSKEKGGSNKEDGVSRKVVDDSLAALEEYAAAGELAAIGETGFDLYDDSFKATEAEQERLFAVHLETAVRYSLPLVLHIRKAMHKVFAYSKELKRLPAVVFHSWPGSPDEGLSLPGRGINACFSFGTTLLLNHKNAIRSCAAFPPGRLLLETDAPWQPLKGKRFSSWEDLPLILSEAAKIRGVEPKLLEEQVERNFAGIYGGRRSSSSGRASTILSA
jgi:TatD DNase family protein